MEGVMMRGPVSWAVAVRKPNSEIAVQTHPLPGHNERHRWMKWPFIRGIYVLVESLTIGMRALKISASYHLEDDQEEVPQKAPEKAPEKALGWSMALAVVFFSAFFIAAPALLSKVGGSRLGVKGDFLQNVFEGAIRIAFFLGYIYLISLIPDIRRVFQYHGAEHKTIYAYENDDPLEPEIVDRYSTLHVRCGTNFLFIVMFLTIIGHFLLDLALQGYPLWLKLTARILAIPVLAGSSYEVIRGAGKKENSIIFRTVSLPGLALQKITTRPPSPDQIEVAIKAMEAVIARESLAEPARQAQAAIAEPSPLAGEILSPAPEPGIAGATPA